MYHILRQVHTARQRWHSSLCRTPPIPPRSPSKSLLSHLPPHSPLPKRTQTQRKVRAEATLSTLESLHLSSPFPSSLCSIVLFAFTTLHHGLFLHSTPLPERNYHQSTP